MRIDIDAGVVNNGVCIVSAACSARGASSESVECPCLPHATSRLVVACESPFPVLHRSGVCWELETDRKRCYTPSGCGRSGCLYRYRLGLFMRSRAHTRGMSDQFVVPFVEYVVCLHNWACLCAGECQVRLAGTPLCRMGIDTLEEHHAVQTVVASAVAAHRLELNATFDRLLAARELDQSPVAGHVQQCAHCETYHTLSRTHRTVCVECECMVCPSCPVRCTAPSAFWTIDHCDACIQTPIRRFPMGFIAVIPYKPPAPTRSCWWAWHHRCRAVTVSEPWSIDTKECAV